MFQDPSLNIKTNGQYEHERMIESALSSGGRQGFARQQYDPTVNLGRLMDEDNARRKLRESQKRLQEAGANARLVAQQYGSDKMNELAYVNRQICSMTPSGNSEEEGNLDIFDADDDKEFAHQDDSGEDEDIEAIVKIGQSGMPFEPGSAATKKYGMDLPKAPPAKLKNKDEIKNPIGFIEAASGFGANGSFVGHAPERGLAITSKKMVHVPEAHPSMIPLGKKLAAAAGSIGLAYAALKAHEHFGAGHKEDEEEKKESRELESIVESSKDDYVRSLLEAQAAILHKDKSGASFSVGGVSKPPSSPGSSMVHVPSGGGMVHTPSSGGSSGGGIGDSIKKAGSAALEAIKKNPKVAAGVGLAVGGAALAHHMMGSGEKKEESDDGDMDMAESMVEVRDDYVKQLLGLV